MTEEIASSCATSIVNNEEEMGESTTIKTIKSQSNFDYRGFEKICNKFGYIVMEYDDARPNQGKRKQEKPPVVHLNNLYKILMSDSDFKQLEYEKSRAHKLPNKIQCVDLEIDAFTKDLLKGLLEKNLFKSIDGILQVGKEAVILQASFNKHKFAIKVFKRTFYQYKRRYKYDTNPERIKKLPTDQYKHLVEVCAQREYHILRDCQQMGLPTPRPIRVRNHLVIMTHAQGPTLEQADLTRDQYQQAYEEIVDFMVISYEKRRIIHTDLNASNVLWCDNRCVFIDFSQSVYVGEDYRGMYAFERLQECCTAILRFFKIYLLDDILTPGQLFKKITGSDENSGGFYQFQREHWKKLSYSQLVMGEAYMKYMQYY